MECVTSSRNFGKSPQKWPPQAPMPVAYSKPPPVFTNEIGEVDTSDAALVVVDGHRVKQISESQYCLLVHFAFHCSQKSALGLFTHDGEPGIPDGLASLNKEAMESDYYLKHARIAIDKYNQVCKANLRLEKILKLNLRSFYTAFYMTFTACDKDTGKVGVYQAALKTLLDGFVLGLFRDASTGKILAIVSVRGAEEELAARKKMVENAKAGKRATRA